jgi:hypothetical protein
MRDERMEMRDEDERRGEIRDDSERDYLIRGEYEIRHTPRSSVEYPEAWSLCAA